MCKGELSNKLELNELTNQVIKESTGKIMKKRK